MVGKKRLQIQFARNLRRYNNYFHKNIPYEDKDISQVFALTVQEAQEFFKDNLPIRNVLTAVIKAGLSYIKLGQTLDSFSGGELQRLKIAQMMLGKKKAGIIILAEPSTGLHEADIDKMLTLFKQLLDEGNTLIVLEHNLSIISRADWIIDLGPKGGDLGGRLMFQGYL